MDKILIEVNRYTIMQLEKAIDKYNKNHTKGVSVGEYHELINRLLDNYILGRDVIV